MTRADVDAILRLLVGSFVRVIGAFVITNHTNDVQVLMLSFPRRLGDELEVQKRAPYKCGNYVGLQRMELGLSVDDVCMVL
jgi:hypothetical protein